jgi:hypothetical protein
MCDPGGSRPGDVRDWRTEPALPPDTMAPDSGLSARRRRRGSRRGEIHFFETRQALVSHFRGIDDAERGYLFNARPAAVSGQISDPYSNRPSLLGALVQWITRREPPPPYRVFLVEQEPTWRAVAAGAALVRRSTTSTPPGTEPGGHVLGPRRYRRQGLGNAAGLALDASASIGIAVSEQAHHVVIITRPPAGEGECQHAVYQRPMGPDFRMGDWQLVTDEAAREYLR